MPLPSVTFQIVTYNSRRWLADCLKSLFEQTDRDWQVLIIDNNSQDDTVNWVRGHYPEVTIFVNKKNLGFAKAHNQGLKILNSPYVVFCNPDIILEPDWLAQIRAAAESSSGRGFASFGGQLLKAKIVDYDADEIAKTEIIDSCGLAPQKSRRFAELGVGESAGAFASDQEVFGHSGALCLYRRSALDDCRIKDEYFDEDFFCYKEDVDLAWRARLLGQKALLVAGARAYHFRALAGVSSDKLPALRKNRLGQSAVARYYSYRNHILLLAKNEFIGNYLRSWPWIFWYEWKKFIYVLFFEWSSLTAPVAALALWPRMFSKRREIFRRRKVSATDINKWFV